MNRSSTRSSRRNVFARTSGVGRSRRAASRHTRSSSVREAPWGDDVGGRLESRITVLRCRERADWISA